jgi:hypothetical protein
VGRAGRGVEHAEVLLLPDQEDEAIGTAQLMRKADAEGVFPLVLAVQA